VNDMKMILLWLVVVTVLVIGVVFYQSRSRSNLNVERHAREVIERAKGR